MFPTTIWTQIGKAALSDRDALESFAARYRAPVLAFIRARGFPADDAEDVCQDVFARVLSGRVLEKADAGKGRFRSLLLTITFRVIQDRRRRRADMEPIETEPAGRDPVFDKAWILHLAERAMARLKEQASPYYAVLRDHLNDVPQDRNRLWIARKKLRALIQAEVAFTCAGRSDFEEEMAYLSAFLVPSGKA